MDSVVFVIWLQVCMLQCYTAMPTSSLVRWPPATQSESPPDIPLPGNSPRRWFSRQNIGRDANGANTRNTRTGNIKWSQRINNLPGSLQNQSSPNRFSSGVFRTFYFSSNNLTNDINRGISDRSNGFKSGPIVPNIFKASKRVFVPNRATNSVSTNTGSGSNIQSIMDTLKKNNSFRQIQTFHSVMKSSNLTSPDFLHDVGKRIQNSIGHNSRSNAYNSTTHVFSGPITWKSFGTIQMPHIFKSTNLTKQNVFSTNGTGVRFNSTPNAFNTLDKTDNSHMHVISEGMPPTTNDVFSGPISWKSFGTIQMPHIFKSTNLTKHNVFSTNGTGVRLNSTPNAFNTLDKTANSHMHVISEGMPPTTTSSTRLKTSSVGTVSRNFSLNSLFGMSDKSQNRIFIQNRENSISNQHDDRADQHSPTQKDIDKIFNSLKLPFFEKKHLKVSSTDIQRDLKEVVKLWMKELDTDEVSKSQSSVVRDTTETDNESATDVEVNSNISTTTIVTDTTDKRLITSIEQTTMSQTLAYVNKTTTSVPSRHESNERTIKIAQDKETSKTPRKQTTEFREVNRKHAGITMKTKTHTSEIKTNNISRLTATPESTLILSSSTRYAVNPMRKRPDAKTNNSNRVKVVSEIPKLEHFHRPKSTVLPPIFLIPSTNGTEGKSIINKDFEPKTAATNIKKSTVRSSTQFSTTSSSLLRRNNDQRDHTPSTHNTTKVIQEKSITPSSWTTLPPIFDNKTDE